MQRKRLTVLLGHLAVECVANEDNEQVEVVECKSEAVTNGVKVSVQAVYDANQSLPEDGFYQVRSISSALRFIREHSVGLSSDNCQRGQGARSCAHTTLGDYRCEWWR